MADPTLLGINKTKWDMLSGLANWFAAAGSFSAAAVALYIANRSNKPSAKVTIGHRLIFTPGSPKPHPEFIEFRIVNTGDRPINVVQIGWKIGLFRKRYAIPIPDPIESSRLPIELSHGQSASWYIPISIKVEGRPWMEYFANDILMPHYRTSLSTIRGLVYSSLGYSYQSKPEAGLMRRLREACVKVANDRRSEETG